MTHTRLSQGCASDSYEPRQAPYLLDDKRKIADSLSTSSDTFHRLGPS